MDTSARGFGEILNDGMAMLGRVWRRLIPPSFGAFVALGAVTIVIFDATGAIDFIDVVINTPSLIESMDRPELLDMTGRFVMAAGLAALVQLVAASFVSLAAFGVVGAELAGTPISAAKASMFAARKTGTLLIAVIAGVFVVLIGLLLLIVPGLWAAGRLSMIGPVIGLEGAGAGRALRRSSELVKGRWWPTVGFLVLVGLLGSVASQLVQLVAVPLIAIGSLGLAAGLSFGVAVVVQGFIVSAMAVMASIWYTDLRAKRERSLSGSAG